MKEDYKKYAVVAISVLMIIVVVGGVYSKRSKNIKYTNINPTLLELTDKTLFGTDKKIKINDDGYVSQIYCDENYIYYMSTPVVDDMSQGLTYDLAYIKKVNIASGNTEIIHEFSGIGRFSISKIVYSKEFLFLSMTKFNNDNAEDSILKMSKETGDTDVVYEVVRNIDDIYGIDISNNYMESYVVWSELHKDYSRNEYKLYDIEKDEIIVYKYEDRDDKNYYGNPSISNNTAMYGAVEDSKNIIICKEIGTGEEVKMELGEEKFASGYIYNNWLVWESSYNSENNYVYLFDFNSENKYLIDSDVVKFRGYGQYIMTIDKNQVSFIDYINREKSSYEIEENQRFVNVINGYVILEQNSDDGGIEVVFVDVY